MSSSEALLARAARPCEARAEVELSADILDYYADRAQEFLALQMLHVEQGEAVVESVPIGVLFCGALELPVLPAGARRRAEPDGG